MRSITSISRETLPEIQEAGELQLPSPDSFDYPEKVLQFGTGVLLRGLPDYFIHQANQQGLFRGRIVMVKSTDRGHTRPYAQQDNLYTLCVRGIQDSVAVEQYILHNVISRVLTAATEWDKVLECARNEAMQLVISNTTEVGIRLVEEPMDAMPPSSFPAKLLAFLHARYRHFGGAIDKGMIIIPTELVSHNGARLKEIVLSLAAYNRLDDACMEWLDRANVFCDSLVDRIVPGQLAAEEQQLIEDRLGYRDALMIAAEPYRLWAIQSPGPAVDKALAFAAVDKGMVLSRDITRHRELKLRLLNGTHSFCCALAILSGKTTVREAMQDRAWESFTRELMLEEIAPALAGELISTDEAEHFAHAVMDRFRNPFIVHPWASIAVQYTSKMRMRNVPLLIAYIDKKGQVPVRMATGLAAYILLMDSEKVDNGYRSRIRPELLLQDEGAERLHHWWHTHPGDPVSAILGDVTLWGTDLGRLPGLADEVRRDLAAMQNGDVFPSDTLLVKARK